LPLLALIHLDFCEFIGFSMTFIKLLSLPILPINPMLALHFRTQNRLVKELLNFITPAAIASKIWLLFLKSFSQLQKWRPGAHCGQYGRAHLNFWQAPRPSAKDQKRLG